MRPVGNDKMFVPFISSTGVGQAAKLRSPPQPKITQTVNTTFNSKLTTARQTGIMRTIGGTLLAIDYRLD